MQAQLRGPPPKGELVTIDGKEPKHGGGQNVLTAVCAPSQYYLGSAIVDTKTNEIPVARQLLPALDLRGRFVSLDALHTQTETARQIVLDAGAHYLLTAKDNQPTLHQTIEKLLPAPRADFPPLATDVHASPDLGLHQEPPGESLNPHPTGQPRAGELPLCRPSRPPAPADRRSARRTGRVADQRPTRPTQRPAMAGFEPSGF